MDLDVGDAALASLNLVAFEAPFTIMRIRGQLLAQLNAAAVNERVVLAVGIIVITEEQSSTGVTAIPNPQTDMDADWIWHGFLTVTSGQEAAIVNEGLIDRLEIDSKAMRRVKPGMSLALVAAVAFSVDQAGSVDFMYGARVLVGD